MVEQSVAVELSPPLATITLNCPTVRNALSLNLMQSLENSFRKLGFNRNVSVIVLAGEGSAFCSGHNLAELIGGGEENYRQLFDQCTNLMKAIQDTPQPVIAQVDGIATAAGCQLVASCDLAVASERAQFATPGVRIGLFCSTPMVPLVRAIGRKRALEMLLTGDPIDAQTACKWGLVNRVMPVEKLSEGVQELAFRIVKGSHEAVKIGKKAFYSQIDLNQSKAYSYVKEVMVDNALTSDAQEGMTAFLEKRNPSWKG